MLNRKPAGYYHCFDPDPRKGELAIKEGETMTCQHCGAQRFIPRGGFAEVGGLCGHCWKFICEVCVRIGSCDPIEEKLRRAEQMAKEHEERTGITPPFNPYRLPE